jgi:sensor histidine kinase YesM
MDALTLSPTDTLAVPATPTAAPRRTGIRLNGYVVIWSLASLLALVTAAECFSVTHVPSLLYGIVLWGWWGCVGSVLWRLGQRAPATLGFSGLSIAAHVFIGCLLGVTHLILLGSPLAGEAPQTPISKWTQLLNINRFGVEFLIYGFLFGITGIIQYRIRAQRETIKSLELQRQLSAAQLRALQMQLEPHFLFNTLNAISTLILDNQNRTANRAVMRLSEFLRYTLDQDPMKRVTLRQEIEALDLYLGTERLRFGERLRLEYAIEGVALDALVPSLLLQPLLENALKYAVSPRELGGMVRIEGRVRGTMLELSVTDDGPGLDDSSRPTERRGGVGLRNTLERLAVLYGDNYRFAVLDSSPGLRVEMALPFETTAREEAAPRAAESRYPRPVRLPESASA